MPRGLAMHRVFAYLLKTRGLDADVVSYFARRKLLYEDAAHHNAVFIGTDEGGCPRHAHLRSTNSFGKAFRLNVESSDPRYSFHHTGTDGSLYVFEAPIDMLSYISIHFVALRYFNACGAHMSGKIGEAHNPETHLIPIVLQVPNGQRDHVSIFGDDYPTRDGTCVRDYIHVTDLASAHILAAEYLMNGGENNVFNLGNGVGFTVKEIIDTAEKVVGKPIKCEMAARRAGDPAQLVASSEKAKTVLGWKPKYDDIETIIGSAWNWHKEHPHGYED